MENDYAYNPAAIESYGNVDPLNDDEIKQFLDDLDHNNDGTIAYDEIEAKLDAVADEVQPDAGRYNDQEHHRLVKDQRHQFLRSIIGSDAKRIPRDEFAKRVREWRIPSLQQEKDEEKSDADYLHKMGLGRRLRSYWAVHGPTIMFMIVVVGMMIAFGVWQLVKYLGPAYRGALGWGVVVAKTCAGILYPTLFFLLLSMSRYLSTLLRRSYRVSRVINWDLSQEFHIYMAIWATFLGSLHGLAHLAGDFVWIGNAYRPRPLDDLLGADRSLRTYRDLIKSLPGITGIIALFCFYVIGCLSTPWVRRKNYEVFQLGHLLMFPIIACLMAHGTKRILQWPMLGYFLAFPTLMILIERMGRLIVGFHPIPATIKILDSETVNITATIPSLRVFNYYAGQYLFLQVPELSFFQWHPFTISVCDNKDIQLHIKTDGNWTSRLRALAVNESEPTSIKIGIDGPYGAPAQRFYDFSHTILVGSGIGITPFSGILTDLQAHDDEQHGGPDNDPSSDMAVPDVEEKQSRPRQDSDGSETVVEKRSLRRKSTTAIASLVRSASRRGSGSKQRNPAPPEFADDYRRVDVHWVVRDKTYLYWFSDLLNEIGRSQLWHRKHDGYAYPHLDIRIHTHVTQKRKKISTHVYRWLLELHRTKDHPASPLTGLINPTQFGRPDFVRILDAHYNDMMRYRMQFGFDHTADGKSDRFKVGVFFCGAPVVGEIIADRCRALTVRGRQDGSRIEYYFMMEVFG